MPIKNIEMNGGKIKSSKQINRSFRKAVSKPIEKQVLKPADRKFFRPAERALGEMGGEMGEFTNKQILPAVVSASIPLASTALGALGAEVGLPPEITSKLSENLLKNYIPKDKQSKNKYVNMFGDALNMAVSGGADPNSMMQLQSQFMNTVSGDLGMNKQPLQSSKAYNPDNPYQDLMLQLMGKYMPIDNTKRTTEPIDDPNDDFDARYGNAELGANADSMIVKTPPFQQREGNATALLGAGLKKKKKNKKRSDSDSESEIEIYTKTKPTYKKFSHAKNSSLDQLLSASADREAKQDRLAMREMVQSQRNALKALGY